MVALEIAINHQFDLSRAELVFFFIEKEKDRFDHLSGLLSSYKLPNNIKYQCINAQFRDVLGEIFDSLDKEGQLLAPAFMFIDPFGIKGVTFEIIKRFMTNPKCEILFTFMIESANRFASTKEFEQHLDALYGTTQWRECVDREDRQNCLISLLETRLRSVAKYVWSFRMLDKRNKDLYFLFFITNHILGLSKMKDAMWRIQPTGDYSFSDRNAGMISLFEGLFDPTTLQNIILEACNGKKITIESLEEFVVAKTDFRQGHIRKALKPLEENDQFRVPTSRKKRFTYPRGTILDFTRR